MPDDKFSLRRRMLLPLALAPWLGVAPRAQAADIDPRRAIDGIGEADLIVIHYTTPLVSHPWNVTTRHVMDAPATSVSPPEKLWNPIKSGLAALSYRKADDLDLMHHGVHWGLSIFSKGNFAKTVFLEDYEDSAPENGHIFGMVDDLSVYFRGNLLETLRSVRSELGFLR